MSRVAPTAVWREPRGQAPRVQLAYLVKSGGRYSVSRNSADQTASFATDSGDSRLYIKDSVVSGARLAYFGAGRRLLILSAPVA